MWCAAASERELALRGACHSNGRSARRNAPAQIGVDVDADALEIAASNMAQFEDLHVDLVHADVSRLPRRLRADTVITCERACRCVALPTRADATLWTPPATRRSGLDARERTSSSCKLRATLRAALCIPCTRRVAELLETLRTWLEPDVAPPAPTDFHARARASLCRHHAAGEGEGALP